MREMELAQPSAMVLKQPNFLWAGCEVRERCYECLYAVRFPLALSTES